MKWEYKRLSRWQTSNIESQLNALGEAGWELCGINDGTFYFKRKKDTWEMR